MLHGFPGSHSFGGSRLPASHETIDKRLHYVQQDGAAVFKYAVRKMEEVCREVLERNGATVDDVSIMIPHQANRRIITGAAERLGIAPEKVLINIELYGNTTAATLPLATRDAIQQGKLRKGDLVLFAVVGAGEGFPPAGQRIMRWVAVVAEDQPGAVVGFEGDGQAAHRRRPAGRADRDGDRVDGELQRRVEVLGVGE